MGMVAWWHGGGGGGGIARRIARSVKSASPNAIRLVATANQVIYFYFSGFGLFVYIPPKSKVFYQIEEKKDQI